MKLKIVLITSVAVLLLDQVTKAVIAHWVPQGSVIPVIPNIFDIVHGRNTGAAFGFLHGWNSTFKNAFFYALAAVATILLFRYVKTLPQTDTWSIAALGLILGGAAGNITDRIVRGSVVDFLSFHYGNEIWRLKLMGYQLTIPLSWPSFNVADAAISVAVVILVFRNLKVTKKIGS